MAKLFNDAQALLKEIIDNKLLTAKAALGFFPANSFGDDIVLHDIVEKVKEVPCDKHGVHTHIEYDIVQKDETSDSSAWLHHLRQQGQKSASLPNRCLSDFVAPLTVAFDQGCFSFGIKYSILISPRFLSFKCS